MNLQEIYNVAKASVDYDTFKIRIAKIYNLCPTDATEVDKLNNLHLTQVSKCEIQEREPSVCFECGGELYYDYMNNYYVCKKCFVTQ